jgi:hypothetical protein
MARPKKGQELNASVHLGVRITQEVKDAIDEEAKLSGRLMTEEVRVLIEESLNARRARRTRATGKAG